MRNNFTEHVMEVITFEGNGEIAASDSEDCGIGDMGSGICGELPAICIGVDDI